jgi:hypothetical protein
VAFRHGQNSEELPSGSVAVAVISRLVSEAGKMAEKSMFPDPSVMTLVEPR